MILAWASPFNVVYGPGDYLYIHVVFRDHPNLFRLFRGSSYVNVCRCYTNLPQYTRKFNSRYNDILHIAVE